MKDSNKKDAAIQVEHVSKAFKLPHEKQTSVKGMLVNIFRSKRTYERQQVLKNISFEIKKGEFFGIVGRNGSGKSTLLKLLAGIYATDQGSISMDGSLTPFIELGVGFNFELTGRENVFLNGALLGFGRKEMERMYSEIVDFAELGRFMDQKLKNYSSGMQVRLAFAIAIHVKGDILLLDEVLAVGDEDFQKKCKDYFEDIKNEGKTVILVTHSMDAVKRYCDRALLLEDGEIKTIGSPIEVANQYSLDNLNAGEAGSGGAKQLGKELKELEVKLLSTPLLSSKESLEFEVQYELNEDIEVDIGFSVIYQGQSVIEHNTIGKKLGSKKNIQYSVKYKLPLKNFLSSEMDIYVSMFKRKGFQSIGFKTRAVSFVVKDESGPQGGLFRERGEWIINKKDSV